MSYQKTELNPKQISFCEQYIIDFNGTQAAIRAGYSAKTANAQSTRLLTNVYIQQYISGLQKKASERNEISVDRIINEYAKIAFSDMKNYMDENNKIKDINTLDSNISGAVSEIQTERRMFNEEPTEFVKFKLHSKTHALDMLGKHLGMFNDEVKHSGTIQINVTQRVINGKDDVKKPPTVTKTS